MTLPTDYIDWVMDPKREDFRRRLNEEKSAWNEGDWLIIDDEEIGRKVYCIGGDEDPKVVVADWESYGVVQWLPDLGQLVRLLVDAGWSPTTLTHIPAHIPDEEIVREEGWEMAAVKISSLAGDQEVEYRFSEESAVPEIAAASLLAKLWSVDADDAS